MVSSSPEAAVGFYVSSPHRVMTGSGDETRETPYGVRHARRPGSAFTECGEGAIGWAMFWDMPFEGDSELVCQVCWNSLIRLKYGVCRSRSHSPAAAPDRTAPAVG